jgi:voltage-gated potassium channel
MQLAPSPRRGCRALCSPTRENGDDTEHGTRSVWDGVWWAITTVTTVATASYPTTTLGRCIAMVVMLVGIGFVAILTATVAERFMRGREAEAHRVELHERLDEILRRLDSIERNL